MSSTSTSSAPSLTAHTCLSSSIHSQDGQSCSTARTVRWSRHAAVFWKTSVVLVHPTLSVPIEDHTSPMNLLRSSCSRLEHHTTSPWPTQRKSGPPTLVRVLDTRDGPIQALSPIRPTDNEQLHSWLYGSSPRNLLFGNCLDLNRGILTPFKQALPSKTPGSRIISDMINAQDTAHRTVQEIAQENAAQPSSPSVRTF